MTLKTNELSIPDIRARIKIMTSSLKPHGAVRECIELNRSVIAFSRKQSHLRGGPMTSYRQMELKFG